MTTEYPYAPLNDPADFASRLTAAEDWTYAALDARQEGRWTPTETEGPILADVVAATNPLHGGHLPPHTGESVYVRLGRIRNWAGVLRLAARAGGWRLRPVVGTDPSSLTRPFEAADLLSGVYALAEQGEQWQRLMLAAAADLSAAARERPARRPRPLGEEIEERAPGFARELAAAEGFFTGPGTLDDLSSYLASTRTTPPPVDTLFA
ncbi:MULTISPECIES: hypothetical protein [unclassified Streptomyces]|uniref:hypothetical protein n=1 Tax=unclassified Streptomyces TaxID=2593676 RepID=UPI0006AE32D9|nr:MULTISPECIES: hypothetical protein [unclassified Streptomyces]